MNTQIALAFLSRREFDAVCGVMAELGENDLTKYARDAIMYYTEYWNGRFAIQPQKDNLDRGAS